MQTQEERNEKRAAMQEEAVRTLLSEERVIVNWGTGVGKSRVAIRCLEEIARREPDFTALLLVTETAHKKNWRNEFNDAIGEERTNELFEHITMECYASFKNYNYTKWTLAIADEAHHLRSDMRTEHLETIYADYFLALSATISDQGDGDKLLETLDRTFGPFMTLEYDVNDAIRDGIIPEPEIKVINMDLNEATRKEYNRREDYLEKKKKEYKDAKEAAGLGYGQENAETTKLSQAVKFAGKMRKDYLGTVKTGMAGWYAKKLRSEGKRFICFCTDIKQAEKLGGPNCIHSEKHKESLKIIDAFNEKQIDSLYVVDMLKEGQNLKDIDAGIIVQLGRKERDFKQRFGRVLRSENPVLYILHIPDTVDDEFLATSLEDVDQKYIHGWEKPKPQQDAPTAMAPAAPVPLPFPTTACPTQPAVHVNVQMPPQPAFTTIQPELPLFQQQQYAQPPATLKGPTLYENIYFDPGMESLAPEKGRFVVRKGGQVTGLARDIRGYIEGIYVDPQYDRINCMMWAARRYYLITVPRKSSWGMLMSLATAARMRELEVTLICSPNGNFSDISAEQQGQKLKWASFTIPKEEPQRIHLINNLVEIINDKQQRNI